MAAIRTSTEEFSVDGNAVRNYAETLLQTQRVQTTLKDVNNKITSITLKFGDWNYSIEIPVKDVFDSEDVSGGKAYSLLVDLVKELEAVSITKIRSEV